MRGKTPQQIGLVGLVGALLLVSSVASAQAERGVVLDFDGRGSGAARNAVVRAAADKLDMARSADVESAARNLGADLSQPAGIAAVAQDQGLTLVITGEVAGRGRRARTRIHVFDDQGNEVAYREAGRPVGRRNRRAIAQAASEAIDQALGAVAERRQQEELERQRAEEAARQAQLAAQAEAEGEEEEEAGTPGGLPILAAFIGLDGRTRDAQADFPGGGGRRYDLSMYPELSLRLESFPLGGSSSALKGLYAQFDIAFALALSSQEVDAMGNPTGDELDTSAWRMLLQVGYQYPLADDAFRLGALVGFGIDSFSIGENDTLPSTSYKFLRIGAVGDARLYEELVRARIDIAYRVILGMGDIADEGEDDRLGSEASGGAFDLGISLGGRIDMGLSYALRFGFTRYNREFSGMAGPGIPENSNFADKGLSLSVQLGYTIGGGSSSDPGDDDASDDSEMGGDDDWALE
jgi:hypothetical protein